MLENVIHLVNKYFLIISYEPNPVLSMGHSSINKRDQVATLMEHIFYSSCQGQSLTDKTLVTAIIFL